MIDMKRNIAFLLVVSALVFLVGCVERTTFNNNHFREYRSFLDYSLGDFQFIEERTGRTSQGELSFGIQSYRFRIWELEYERQNGEISTFIFNNRASMSSQVKAAAIEIAQEDISDVISTYISRDQFEIVPSFVGAIGFSPRAFTEVVLNIGLEDTGTDILDSETGLQLYSATTQSLMNNWGLGLSGIEIRQPITPSASGTQNLLAMARPLSAYTRQDEVFTFSFTLRTSGAYANNVTFTGYYNLENDALVLHEVRGRTNHPRLYADTANNFKEIVRLLAELTEQDKVKVDFLFTFRPDVMETLSLDWVWFHGIEYYCKQTDSFLSGAE